MDFLYDQGGTELGFLNDLFGRHAGFLYLPDYDWIDDRTLDASRAEAAFIIKRFPPMEQFHIAAFPGKNAFELRWFGQNKTAMLKTLHDLKLPSTPTTNAAELSFYYLIDHLKTADGQTDLVFTTYLRISYKKHLKFLAAKLLHIYGGGHIDASFFEKWRNLKHIAHSKRNRLRFITTEACGNTARAA